MKLKEGTEQRTRSFLHRLLRTHPGNANDHCKSRVESLHRRKYLERNDDVVFAKCVLQKETMISFYGTLASSYGN